MNIKTIVLAINVLLICACGGNTDDGINDEIICTTEARAGILINVFDQTTGDPLCGVDGLIMANEYVEEIQSPVLANCADAPFQGAHERTGTYQVVVSKVGYQDWQSDAISVEMADECHVDTQILEVYLNPVE